MQGGGGGAGGWGGGGGYILGHFGLFGKRKCRAHGESLSEMQVFSLKQPKQIIVYRFSLQVRIPDTCGLDRNLVKNISQMNVVIFVWVEK